MQYLLQSEDDHQRTALSFNRQAKKLADANFHKQDQMHGYGKGTCKLSMKNYRIDQIKSFEYLQNYKPRVSGGWSEETSQQNSWHIRTSFISNLGKQTPEYRLQVENIQRMRRTSHGIWWYKSWSITNKVNPDDNWDEDRKNNYRIHTKRLGKWTKI